jgi:hypothetical protein
MKDTFYRIEFSCSKWREEKKTWKWMFDCPLDSKEDGLGGKHFISLTL